MATFQLNIVSTRGRIFAGDVESLIVPGVEGDLGVLAGHAPMIALIRRGVGKVETGTETHHYVFGEGVLEVTKKDVVLLSDTADRVGTHAEALAKAAELIKAAASEGKGWATR
ncbi:MAG TPA: ATP synthase F1 subunit epsilon [Kiritimatiellia bacterium]|jgi:F-type H+-transporting ATPase subunit epsilon